MPSAARRRRERKRGRDSFIDKGGGRTVRCGDAKNCTPSAAGLGLSCSESGGGAIATVPEGGGLRRVRAGAGGSPRAVSVGYLRLLRDAQSLAFRAAANERRRVDQVPPLAGPHPHNALARSLSHLGDGALVPRPIQGFSAGRRRTFLHGGAVCGTQRITSRIGRPSRGLALVEPVAIRIGRRRVAIALGPLAASPTARLGGSRQRPANRSGARCDPPRRPSQQPVRQPGMGANNRQASRPTIDPPPPRPTTETDRSIKTSRVPFFCPPHSDPFFSPISLHFRQDPVGENSSVGQEAISGKVTVWEACTGPLFARPFVKPHFYYFVLGHSAEDARWPGRESVRVVNLSRLHEACR